MTYQFIDISHTIYAVPKSLTKNGRARSHWRTQHRETQELKETAMFELLNKKNLLEKRYRDWEFPFFGGDPPNTQFKNPNPIIATVHQVWCGKPLDWDGLASAVAPIIDAFTEVGIIKDDSPLFITDYKMTQRRTAHRKDAHITVTLNGRIYYSSVDSTNGYFIDKIVANGGPGTRL